MFGHQKLAPMQRRADSVTGRDFLTAWTRSRSALATCLLLTLIVIGGAGRMLPPSPTVDQPSPMGALVDGHAASEHGVRPGQTGLRLVPDLRQPRPAVDGSTSAVVISPPPMGTWARDGQVVRWPVLVTSASAAERFAHLPRGPPARAKVVDHSARNAGVALLVSWNRGPIFPQGPHRT